MRSSVIREGLTVEQLLCFLSLYRTPPRVWPLEDLAFKICRITSTEHCKKDNPGISQNLKTFCRKNGPKSLSCYKKTTNYDSSQSSKY